MIKPLEIIDYIVVHSSGTPPEDDDVDALWIDKVHRGFGWSKIGFHMVIKRDGEVQLGRQEDEIGQHANGFDDISLSVCLVGGVHPTETYTSRGRSIRKPWPYYTAEQLKSLRGVLEDWRYKYKGVKIVGHSDLFRGQSCPGFDVGRWFKSGEIHPQVSGPMVSSYVRGVPIAIVD